MLSFLSFGGTGECRLLNIFNSSLIPLEHTTTGHEGLNKASMRDLEKLETVKTFVDMFKARWMNKRRMSFPIGEHIPFTSKKTTS